MLIVPCCESGKGGGHLTRCIRLTADLRAMDREAWLFLSAITKDTDNLLHSMNFNLEWRITKEELEKKKFNLIVLDRFQTPRNELEYWKKIATVIGIDEGGSFRDSFDFLIDMLIPENFIKPAANIYSPKLLVKDITQKKEKREKSAFSILITFGHEDKAGLGVKTTQELLKNKYNGMEITLLKGGLNNSLIPSSPNLKIMETIPNLSDRISEYDLIITHYGITAYEALFAGTPVLLAHPGPYHKKLAKAAGFISFPKYMTQRHGVTKKIKIKCKEITIKFKSTNDLNLAEFVNGFSPQVNHLCPACGSEKSVRSIARFDDRTYRRCPHCGVIYMDRICQPSVEYEREYFFEQYQKQYGKTYLEDFENIKNAGILRLNKINSLLPLRDSVSPRDEQRVLSLLDIGCAYGPFLAAARDEGFSPFGIEPAEDAVRYVNEQLGIPAIHSPFPSPHSLLPVPFDVITLWYVIEHFRGCSAVLAEIKKILKPGGILAFSTPSFSGISARASIKNFLSKSPADHFTVWSPKMCKKALALAGFKVKKTVTSGHHPERFPLLGKFAKSRKSPLFWILLAISKLFGLGDTFEVYATTLPSPSTESPK